MPDTTPLVHTLRVQVDPVAGGADAQFVLGEAPFAGVISRAAYIPSAAVTGAATNNRTVTVTNRGQAGAGVAVAASVQFASGVNAVADDAKELTLSGTPANLVVAAGDVLTAESTHIGTGIADPGGTFLVEITRS
jgi:hypothetical protein